MTRHTAAYSAYLERIEEVVLLAKRAQQLERSGSVAHQDEINALCRAAVVLQCSHLEGYIKSLGEITTERIFEREVPRSKLSGSFFYFVSKDHFDKIDDTKDKEKIAERVFTFVAQDGDMWSRDGAFPGQIPYEQFATSFGSPSLKKIASFLGRFGAVNVKHQLQSRLAADYNATTNMVSHMVSTRNNIAHGDAMSTMTPGDVLQMVVYVRRFARTTDDIFASWCSKNLCTIR